MKHRLRCIHNFNGFHLLTYCFSFWFTLSILCIEQTMLGAHCMLTFIKTLIIQQCDNKRFICDFVSISYDLQGSFM